MTPARELSSSISAILTDAVGATAIDRRAIAIRQKSSSADLVTQVDVELQDRLGTALRQLLPEAGFVGEEGDGNGPAPALRWIVDPIDGTTNFIHGIPYAAIAVSLVDEEGPLAAVVRNIFTGESYGADRGHGAYAEDGAREHHPLRVSAVSRLDDAVVSFGLPYDRARTADIFEAASRVFLATQDLRRRGSASLDLVSVATGQTEAHFELDLRVWDIAAGLLIVGEAGGRVTGWDGSPVSLIDRDSRSPILASNGSMHEPMSRLLRP